MPQVLEKITRSFIKPALCLLLVFGCLFGFTAGSEAAAVETNALVQVNPPGGIQSLLSSLNVSNLQNSIDFYQNKLGLIRNTKFDTDDWTQFFVIGKESISQISPATPQIGLYQGSVKSDSTSVPTIIVNDIEQYRDYLLDNGIKVGGIIPIEVAGGKVGLKLAFFTDPDGNKLTIRQNLI
ncbi:lactoylglutathione lyase-like lyase [Cylindrospermum stagnale PCC 7417]|uniref:Lactoylglutathione lyase-like lyase n=1 Tax=Cylindrospermum stagnale PCC 7417 TaxID=56107 RepID=K9WVB4_9NOST|nr:VOC family protein [Cylindrospermum stagnale]AFZ23457.1 lactoylglutathione lyase-like lyase [Cylindrospermum stagnale PCC 7417]